MQRIVGYYSFFFWKSSKKEELYFDPATGKLSTHVAPPTLQEYMANPENYPNYEVTMDYNSGKMEVMTKAEAQRRTDTQVVKRMAADGFFTTEQFKALDIA